jgi:dimethylargininase
MGTWSLEKRLKQSVKMFGYTHVITREVPNTFFNAVTMETTHAPIDVELAKKQHENYNKILSSIIPKHTEVFKNSYQMCICILTQNCKIVAEESTPDCVFIEGESNWRIYFLETNQFISDPCVIIENKVLINNLGHHTRVPEAIGVRSKLLELGLQITDMKPPATLDGGDVLVTGIEILVGISSR